MYSSFVSIFYLCKPVHGHAAAVAEIIPAEHCFDWQTTVTMNVSNTEANNG